MKLTIDLTKALPPDHLARAIDRYVELLDTSAIESKYSVLGQKAYHPKLLLKAIFYGYATGSRSGRVLELKCVEDIAYIFLCRNYSPSATTFNDFRKAHIEHLEDLFIQVIKFCQDLGLGEASTSFHDGTKMSASASARRTKNRAEYSKWLQHLEKDIVEIEEQIAKDQDNLPSDHEEDLQKKLKSRKRLREKIQKTRSKLTNDKDKLNLTDEDARFMKSKNGHITTNYNPQIVTNEQGIILYNTVITSASDKAQLQPGIQGTERNTGQKILKSVADAGFSSYDNYEYLLKNNIIGYIPDQDTHKKTDQLPFHRKHFRYVESDNTFICPQAKPLVFVRYHQDKRRKTKELIYRGTQCQHCPSKAQCTKGKARQLHIELREPLREQMRQRLCDPKAMLIYKKRMHLVEVPFAHFKHNLGFTHFILRGLRKVKAEFNLMCIAYNLRKIASFITKFQSFSPLVTLQHLALFYMLKKRMIKNVKEHNKMHFAYTFQFT